MENYKTSRIGQNTARKYADILDKQRPCSEESLRRHPRMSLQNRAKIFSPFAALRGYDEQLEKVRQAERAAREMPDDSLTDWGA